MKKKRNFVLNKRNKKILLIIWIISISNIYTYYFLNLYPISNNLCQRADFFSFLYAKKEVNEENSELVYGSEIEGSVKTSLKIPKKYVNQEFCLRIEADTKRTWDFASHGKDYRPTKDFRIEVIINGEIIKVFSYDEVPEEYYPSGVTYGNLVLSNKGSRFSCSENFKLNSSRNSIRIRLITNHSLRSDKRIFSDYFYNDEYCLTISIGDPDIIFFIISIIFFLNWYLFIINTILERFIYDLIALIKKINSSSNLNFISELKKIFKKK